MKVRPADVARELGLSRATVSLALNNKPGVSQQTRQRVIACMQQMQDRETAGAGDDTKQKGSSATDNVQPESAGTFPTGARIIKVVIVNGREEIVQGAEMDLWTSVMTAFDQVARKNGYTLGISYVDVKRGDAPFVVAECNDNMVAGVILFATELQPEEVQPFTQIRKPMVVYDNDFPALGNGVTIDNEEAAWVAVEYLWERGCHNIWYLAHQADIYNFRRRRIGFRLAMEEHGVKDAKERMLTFGSTSEEAASSMKEFLRAEHSLPEAVVMENYQISIGVYRELQEQNIAVPGRISLIGIDTVPVNRTPGCRLTTVAVSHTNRANTAMQILLQEIRMGVKPQATSSFHLLSRCRIEEGDSVRPRT